MLSALPYSHAYGPCEKLLSSHFSTKTYLSFQESRLPAGDLPFLILGLVEHHTALYVHLLLNDSLIRERGILSFGTIDHSVYFEGNVYPLDDPFQVVQKILDTGLSLNAGPHQFILFDLTGLRLDRTFHSPNKSHTDAELLYVLSNAELFYRTRWFLNKQELNFDELGALLEPYLPRQFGE